jgi:uncharacterized delta-60 repeat protein
LPIFERIDLLNISELYQMKNLLVVVALTMVLHLHAQTVDPTYQGVVTSIAEAEGGLLFSDGKYLLYGKFKRFNGGAQAGVAKFNADGSVDNTFNLGTGPNGTVLAAAVQSDGKILLAGRFTSFNGVNRSTLIRLNTDGSIDNTFTPNVTINSGGIDFNLLVQTDGKIIFTGPLTVVDGASAPGYMMRFNSNGSKDGTFISPSIGSQVMDMALQPDGKIVVGGSFTKGIARFNSDGSNDVTFSAVTTGFDNVVFTVAVSTTNQIFAGGGFSSFNGAANSYLACLTSTGSLDGTWQGNGKPNNPVLDFYLQSDNKLLAAGGFSTYGGIAAKAPWRLATNGSLDATLIVGAGASGLRTITSNSTTNDILITGSPLSFTSYSGTARKGVAIIQSNGTLKSMTVQPNFQYESWVMSIKAQGADKFLIGHQGDEVNGTASTGFERLNIDGTLDGTFSGNSKPNDYVIPITIDHNNNILIGGVFTSYNSTSTGRIARLSSSGVLDATFTTNTGTGFNNVTYSIVEQPDGKILVGGAFTSFNATLRRAFARLNSNGSLDATFNTANGFLTSTVTPIIHDIEVLSDGKILVAGEFDSFDGHSVKGLVRLNSDGTFDNTFLIGAGAYSSGGGSGSVEDIIVLSNNKILIGGVFNSIGATTFNCFNLALLNSDGSLNNGYSSGGFFGVQQLEKQSNDKIIVMDRNTGLRRLNGDGTVDGTFTGISIDNYPEGVAFFGNTMIVAGWLEKTSNQITLGLAKIDLPAAVPSAPNPLGTTGILQTQINLSWSDNSATETGYYLERSTGNNTNYQVIATLDPSNLFYFNTGLTSNTQYYYRITAFNAAGNSAYSNEVSATTLLPPPATPTSLSLSVINAGEIKLTWVDNSTNESGFEIYRSVGNNSGYSLLTTRNPNVTTYSDLTTVEGTLYYYKLKAINSGGSSGYAPEKFATAANPTPTAPSNLQATGVPGDRVDLTWTDNSSNETGFKIERALYNTSDFQLITTTTENATSYSDMTVTNSIKYTYRVSAVYGASQSGFTNYIFVTPPPPVPAAPSSLTVVSNTPTSVNLTWVDNASDEVDYVIERSTSNNTSYSQLVVLSPNATQYTDVSASYGAVYYYRVTARNSFGSSIAIEKFVTVGYFLMGDKSVTACQGFFLDSGYDGNYANNENYTIKLYPATAGSSVQLVFSSFNTDVNDQLTIYNGTTILDPLIGTYSGTTSPGTVRATNADGALTIVFQSNASTVSSGWQAAISCGIFPAAPGNVQSIVTNTSEVKISWTDNATNETGYAVERSLTGPTASDFVNVATLAANTTNYSDNTVAVNTTYYYRVKAKGPQVDSDFAPVHGLAFGNGGVWRLRKDFTGIARTDAVGFAVGGKGYVGLGWAGGAQTSNFRSYDQNLDSWSTVTSFAGSVRSEAAAFVVGDKAYVGTGEWLDPANDLWEYNPSTNAWTGKANFGGTPRTGAIGFAIGDKGYFGFGKDANGYTKDFWQFDPQNNSWVAVTQFPGDARNGAVVFVIDNFAYAGTGYNGTARLKDFYKYDPSANTWTPIATFPGAARDHAIAFAVSGKGYVGTGDSGTERRDFWSYDPSTDSWQQLLDFGGSARSVATAFALNNKGYVSTGFDGSNKKDLWEFTATDIPVAPIAPSNLTATAISSSQINLQWIDNSSNENGFVIERSPVNSTSFQMLATLPANSTSYSDTGIDPATVYYYRVKMTTASAGSSGFSAIASTTTLPLAPATPTNLTAVVSINPAVQLSWTDNATNETAYTIERSTANNASFSSIATIGANAISYTDNTATYSTTYYYRVKSTNSGGSSAYSNEANVTTAASAISTPTGLTAETLSSSSIRLRWTDNSNNESSFSIHRSTDPTNNFVEVAVTNANTVEYSDINLLENKTYYYKIKAVGALGSSAFTIVVSATTLKSIPIAPTNLTASYNATSDNITLQWTDASSNEEDFVLEKSFNGTTYSILTATTGTTFIDEDPGTTFRVFYRVGARNSAGTSYSNTAQIVMTGIESRTDLAVLKTYPNPVVDKLTIELSLPDRGIVNIAVFDVTGRELNANAYEKSSYDFTEQIDLKALAGNAILILKVSIGEIQMTRKIVLK